MCNAWERRKMHKEIWWESLKERDRLKDLGVDARIFKWVLQKQNGSGMVSSG
jgi:hypothetical protein